MLSLSENYERKWYIYYLLGCSHFEKKEFREALEYLERTVSENPDFAEGYVKLGFAHIEMGERERGLKMLEHALEIAPENWRIHYLLAKGKLEAGEILDAKEHIQKAIQLKEDAAVFVLFGRVLAIEGETEKAIAEFGKAVDINPACFEGWYYKGKVLFEKKELEKAISALEMATQINPWHYNSHLYRGLAFEELKKYEKAIECYQEILKVFPNDYTALFRMGNDYFAIENWEKAAHAFEKCFNVKQTYEAAQLLGIAYKRLGKIEQAIQFFEKAVEINPFGHEAFFEMGTIRIERKEISEAIHNLEMAVKILPSEQYLKYLGIAYYRNEEFEKALGLFERLQKDLECVVYAAECALKLGMEEKAMQYLSVLDSSVTNFDAWMLRGRCEEKLGKLDEALKSYSKAIEISADRLEAWQAKGNLLYALGRKKEAMECFEHILNAQRNPENLTKVAEVAIALGEYEKALAAIEEIVGAGTPLDLHQLRIKGEALLGIKDFTSAAKCFEEILGKGGDKEDQHNLAKAYVGMGEYEKAILSLEKYLQAEERDVEGWRLLSECYYACGENEKCVGALVKCTELNPNLFEAWYNMGTVLLKLKKFEDAEKAFLRALEISPNDPKCWNNLGIVYLSVGKFEEALRVLDSAITVELGNSEAWFNKGMVLMKMGRNREAIECFDRTISIKPEYIDALFVKGSAYFAIGEYEKTAEVLSEFIAQKNEHFEARMLRGRAYLEIGKAQEALEDFKVCIGLQNADPAPWKFGAIAASRLFEWITVMNYVTEALKRNSEDAECWLLKGLGELHIGHLADAVKCCSYASELDKKIVSAYFIKATAHIMMGEFAKAIQTMEKCVIENNDNGYAHFLFASAIAKFGKREDALKWFESAISIQKNRVILWGLAKFFFEIEKYREALETLHQIKGQGFLEYYLMGIVCEKMKNERDAVLYLKKSLELSPEFYYAGLELSRVLCETGNYGEAISVIENIQTSEAKRLRGLIYSKLERWDKVIDELMEFARPEKIDGEVAYSLALAFFNLKKYIESKDFLEIAKSLLPPSAEKWMLIGKITVLEGEMEKNSELVSQGIEYLRKALHLMPDTFEPYYAIAKAMVDNGRHREALEYAETLAKKFRHVPAGALVSARIFEANGMIDDALASYLLAIEKSGSIEAKEGAARCYLQKGDYKNAMEYGMQVLGVLPDSSIIGTVALARSKAGEKDALIYLEKALEKGFLSEDIVAEYCRNLLAVGEYEKLEGVLRKYEKYLAGAVKILIAGFVAKGEYTLALEILDKYQKEGDWEVLKLRGEIFERMGELKEAIASYEKAYMTQPENSELAIGIARCYFRNGDRKRTREFAEKAIMLNRKSDEAFYLLAACTDGEEREAHVKNALALNAENLNALVLYGKILLQKGDFAGAIQCYEKARKLSDTRDVLMLGARAKLAAGKYEEVSQILSEIREESEDVLEIEAELHMRRGEYGKAVDCYEKLVAMHKKFEYLLGIARAWKALGDFEKAGVYYTEALGIKPVSEEVWEELVSMQISRKMLGKLRNSLESYIKLNPANSSAYYNLGILLMGEDLVSAEKALKKSIELNKMNEKAWNALGSVYLQKNELDSAVECFRKATEINPLYWKALYNLALAYSKKKDFVKALEALENVERITPEHFEVLLLKGTILLALKKISEGEKVFAKLYASNSKNERVIFNYGVCKMLSGNIDEALVFFEKAIELKGDYVEAWVNKGIIHYRKGDLKNAGIAFETVLRYDRNNKIARKYLEEMG
ncbi:MAG: tetratricopeptide repeat protein [Thermoplasmata archaeon]